MLTNFSENIFELTLLFVIIVIIVLIGVIIGDALTTVEYSDTGVIVGKDYDPAHTSVSTVWNGKTWVTQTRYVPAHYALIIKTEHNGKVTISVNQKTYNRMDVGFQVYVSYKQGKLLGIQWSGDVRLEQS